MIVYGRNPVREALRGRRAYTATQIWATHGAAREPWLQGHAMELADAEALERRCGSSGHQGVCVEVGPYPYVSAEELLGEGVEQVGEGVEQASKGDKQTLLVVLDQIQDPQNLGSICRTCECVGATGVVIPERRAVEITPAVCKASAGAVEHLAVARVRNIADFLAHARAAAFWCYGASAEGATMSYEQPDYRGPVALVLGSEGRGLRPRVAAACDALIALPLHGRIESLGVSAAAAALLYEILQNRARALDKSP